MYRVKRKRTISLFAIVSFTIFALIFTVYIISKYSIGFADFINDNISSPYRFLMARFSSPIPFSLYELAVISIPLQIIALVWYAVWRFRSGEGRLRFILNVTAAALLLYAGHLLALGVAYNTTPLAEKLEIAPVEVTEDRLADVMTALRDEVNELSDEVVRDEAGVSNPGYTLDEISALICDSYEDFSEEYGFPAVFDSRVKGIVYSNVMSYFSITGIYTFYTGEANVNTSYPAYDIVFTAAHELSHQRGVLRENEANFMAYLICSRSSDAYLRYSAALSMYEYIGNALYRTNKNRYYEIANELSDGAKYDILASRAVYEEYSGTLLEKISTNVNDLFLKSNGTEGVISYSMVTRLTVAYFESKR